MNVCIIPARGGSKRIPRKNVRPFLGQPLIAYSIREALSSGLFSDVIVSTDDREIAEVARQWGASVPFMRPSELADDHANTFDLMAHAAQWVTEHKPQTEFLCCLYATAPFVQAQYLRQGLETLRSARDANYCYSITDYAFPIQRSVRLNSAGFVVPWMPEYMLKRSQDLEAFYHDAGQFYWGRLSAFANGSPFFAQASLGVILPRYRVVDIDTEDDWVMAEVQYRTLEQLHLE
ncbi:MAG: pseudaminic acid cytidylyltransferase [Saccharospirillum sp.]